MDSSVSQRSDPETAPGQLPALRVAGHDLSLFVESPPLIDRMAADIQTAKHRVWLEVYIFADDDQARRIAALLAEKARAGLDVRVMYDAVGSQSTSASLFAEMAAAGVKVHAFHTFWYALSQWWSFFDVFNRRNHRKLLVIDDRLAYFGGMNVVDTRRAESAKDELPISGGWRDVHVRMTGPQVADVAESFDRSWRRAHHRAVRRRPRSYRRAKLPAGVAEAILFFDSGPGLKYSRAERAFTRLIGRARQRIVLSMAYFLPTRRVMRALLSARKRDVAITVIVPAESDVPIVQRATRHLYGRLLARGIVVYERERQMLHSKAMVADDCWTIVGSSNLDPRSLEINLEFLAVVQSASLAAQVTGICDEEIEHSRRITIEDCNGRGFWQRTLDRMAYAFRFWL